MSVQVSKIILDISGKKIELSLAEARELQKALADTLGTPEQPAIRERVIEHYPYWPWWRDHYYSSGTSTGWTIDVKGTTITYATGQITGSAVDN